MGDQQERLRKAIDRRDRARSALERAKGRLDNARSELGAIESECRDKGVDPDSLEAAIERLTDRYNTVVSQLETSITEAEQALRPYTGKAVSE